MGSIIYVSILNNCWQLYWWFGFYDDAITKVSQDGEILFIKSVSEILIENKIKDLKLLDVFDPIHLNDIQPAKFDSSIGKKWPILSLPRINAIVHYRPSTNKVINFIKVLFHGNMMSI